MSWFQLLIRNSVNRNKMLHAITRVVLDKIQEEEGRKTAVCVRACMRVCVQ